ncbi:MAG: NYN domain-containing protein [Ignavibacteriae bacterium]|nr:NYN domain-containing protein [Ignavibacteriota bacterium]
MNRTTFIIDGFNLYHSVVKASMDLQNASTKWLDIFSLCKSYLPLISKDAIIEKIYYFSALANHLQQRHPDKIKKHMLFINALKSTGIVVELGRFKEKEVYCDTCKKLMVKHEEKETDVAMSVKIFEILIKNETDTIVIFSGDTDIAPVIRTTKILYPSKRILFGFPYKRYNNELKKLSPESFSISKEQYVKFQFPNKFIFNEQILIKPSQW